MVTARREAERALALSYAPEERRGALQALLALDDLLGSILRSTREPLVGQMRLTWWHEALVALDRRPPPAQPELNALAATVLPRGVTGRTLAGMVVGWEALLSDPLDEHAMRAFAAARGGALFAAGARVLGADGAGITTAGEGWALADLAGHVADVQAASVARRLAAERLDGAFGTRWARPVRALGALALLARADLTGAPIGSPRRVARLLRHRLTGR